MNYKVVYQKNGRGQKTIEIFMGTFQSDTQLGRFGCGCPAVVGGEFRLREARSNPIYEEGLCSDPIFGALCAKTCYPMLTCRSLSDLVGFVRLLL